jgi:hypothetical protein
MRGAPPAPRRPAAAVRAPPPGVVRQQQQQQQQQEHAFAGGGGHCNRGTAKAWQHTHTLCSTTHRPHTPHHHLPCCCCLCLQLRKLCLKGVLCDRCVVGARRMQWVRTHAVCVCEMCVGAADSSTTTPAASLARVLTLPMHAALVAVKDTHIETHTHRETHTHTRAHTRARTHTHTHAHTRAHTNTHTHTHTHAHTRAHTHTHTHTHTHSHTCCSSAGACACSRTTASE